MLVSDLSAGCRYADDEDMNNELKEQERWNDPAANFLTVRPPFPFGYSPSDHPLCSQKDKKKEKKNAPKYPRYTGPAPPPNRFGIPPGYRWDGVDRVRLLHPSPSLHPFYR